MFSSSIAIKFESHVQVALHERRGVRRAHGPRGPEVPAPGRGRHAGPYTTCRTRAW